MCRSKSTGVDAGGNHKRNDNNADDDALHVDDDDDDDGDECGAGAGGGQPREGTDEVVTEVSWPAATAVNGGCFVLLLLLLDRNERPVAIFPPKCFPMVIK